MPGGHFDFETHETWLGSANVLAGQSVHIPTVSFAIYPSPQSIADTQSFLYLFTKVVLGQEMHSFLAGLQKDLEQLLISLMHESLSP